MAGWSTALSNLTRTFDEVAAAAAERIAVFERARASLDNSVKATAAQQTSAVERAGHLLSGIMSGLGGRPQWPSSNLAQVSPVGVGWNAHRRLF